MGILRKSGAFISYGETRLGQGRENARDFLRNNTEIRDEIERQIRSSGRDVIKTELAEPVAAGAE
jgi:recombination protein RecA